MPAVSPSRALSAGPGTLPAPGKTLAFGGAIERGEKLRMRRQSKRSLTV